jgi:hypothetical protein
VHYPNCVRGKCPLILIRARLKAAKPNRGPGKWLSRFLLAKSKLRLPCLRLRAQHKLKLSCLHLRTQTLLCTHFQGIRMSSPQNNRPASISLDQDQWFDQWLANDSTDGVGAAAPATAAASSPITAPNTDDQSWSKDHCNTTVPSRMDLLDNINLSRVPLLDHVLTNDIQTVGAQNLFGDVFGNVEWDTGFTPSDFINLQTLSFPINDQASDFAFGGPTLDPSSNNQTPDFVDTCQASRLPTHGQHPNILVNDRNPGTIYYENSGFNDIFHTSANSALVAECQLFSTHIDVQVATPIPCTLATNHVPQNRPNQYMQAILPKPPAFSPLQIVEPFQAGPSLMQRSWELNTTGKWIAPNEQGLAQSKNIVLKEIRNVAPSKVNKIYGPSIAKRAKKRQNAMLESYCFNFVSRPQPVSKKPARRKGVRSCLACNKNHLKVFTVYLYSKLKTLI